MTRGDYISICINAASYTSFLLFFFIFIPDSFSQYFWFSLFGMATASLIAAGFTGVSQKFRARRFIPSIEWIAIFLGLISIFFRAHGNHYGMEYLLPIITGIKFGELFLSKILRR
ncbi:hypothetical protein [Herbaspirillum sp. meg3]|uniref:hypothetical protein n=1 Tax=Herbaspirillum sp. meg3 TaxID=2025949 RepID=UPI0012FE73A2|nr:hypothetical protein [Herbaspirillum sp. meg3]